MPRRSCNPTPKRIVSVSEAMDNPIKLGVTIFAIAIASVIVFGLLGTLIGFAFKLAMIAAVGFVVWGLVSAGAKALSGGDRHRLP